MPLKAAGDVSVFRRMIEKAGKLKRALSRRVKHFLIFPWPTLVLVVVGGMLFMVGGCAKPATTEPVTNPEIIMVPTVLPTPVPTPVPAKIYFFNVVAFPTNLESITLKNNSAAAVDLSRWLLGNSVNPAAFCIPDRTMVAPGDTVYFGHKVLGFQIIDAGETLFLADARGNTVSTWRN
ncbi:MAG: lamin tail domain-containing protein [Candidatus Firestonebacteria bacterium]|nr:lamin tail domain-containing protein [Candidatus Firestonebacteria bacterium]